MIFKTDYIRRIVELSDRVISLYDKRQVKDPSSPDFGGFMDENFGCVATIWTGYFSNLFMLYFCPQSIYYHSEKAYELAKNYSEYGKNHTRPSGRLDYLAANYDSGPDTAFSVITLALAYNTVKPENIDERGKELIKICYEIIEWLSHGVFTGGFHTPNHRWVETAALALSMNITGRKEYLERINAFLAEGIDCDEHGEYTERSAGHYNYINNMALYYISEQLEKPELLQYVRRNLLMMKGYYNSDFEIFTQNSTRQDKGTLVYADKYIWEYLQVGYLLGDKELLSVGKAIAQSAFSNGRPLLVPITHALLYPDLLEIPDVEPWKCDETYMRNPGSSIIKYRHNGMNVSVMENRDIFFFLETDSLELSIKGGVHFFNERHFIFKVENSDENGCTLKYHGEGKYYLPFGKFMGTSDFNDSKMDRETREQTKPITIDITLTISKTENGFLFKYKGEGCDKVPCRLETAISADSVIFGDGYIIRANPGGKLIPQSGSLRIDRNAASLKISPVFADHYITDGLFYSNPVDTSKYNIFLNATIPFEREFTVEKA